ncbi:MAG TPA: hypothetical protein VKT72_14970 [Candidatus Baltobacteraceae bacterium]|nr:hypothetical protein [Candidatus Baltobacteraceae bacterium]
MAAFLYFILVVMVGVQSGTISDHSAIQVAEDQRHGAGTRLTSVLISGGYAVARGAGGIHDGLVLTPGGWRVACQLGGRMPNVSTLKRLCGFSTAAALQLAADELANAAAAQGQFSTAVRSEQTAYQAAPESLRPSEAARLQLLNQLSQQLQTGQSTRTNAIRKWNELRLSIFLP